MGHLANLLLRAAGASGSGTGGNYADTVNALSPVAYYRLGESSGTTAIDETGNYHGTYVGSPTLGATGLLIGDPDTAVGFDGTDDKMYIASNAVLDNIQTVSFMVNIAAMPTGNAACIISRHDSVASYNGFTFTILNDVLSLGVKDNLNNNIYIKASALSINTTYHIVGIFSNTSGYGFKLYIDGTLVDSDTSSISFTYNTVTLNLAISNDSYWENFNGTIDEVAIFDTALTQQQVTDLYNATGL